MDNVDFCSWQELRDEFETYLWDSLAWSDERSHECAQNDEWEDAVQTYPMGTVEINGQTYEKEACWVDMDYLDFEDDYETSFRFYRYTKDYHYSYEAYHDGMPFPTFDRWLEWWEHGDE